MLRQRITPQLKRRGSRSRERRLIVPLQLQDLSIRRKRMLIVLNAQKQITDLPLLQWIIPNILLQRDQLRLCLRLGSRVQQKLDQLQPGIPPLSFLIARPSCIDRIVVVAQRLFGLSLFCRDARQFEIDQAVLRLALPKIGQLGRRLSGPLESDQSFSQI